MKDLVVLVPDKNTQSGINGIVLMKYLSIPCTTLEFIMGQLIF